VASVTDGALATGIANAFGSDQLGVGLTKIDAAGASIFTATIGGTQTGPGAVAAAGARFVVVGSNDGLTDFDPGPGTDYIDRGFVNFASRYSF
jgi:hypothetical protein